MEDHLDIKNSTPVYRQQMLDLAFTLGVPVEVIQALQHDNWIYTINEYGHPTWTRAYPIR